MINVFTDMPAFLHPKATVEALRLARRGGLDLAGGWEAIRARSGNAFVHGTEGALILDGSCDVAFSIDLALNGLGLALGFGREVGVPLDLAAATSRSASRPARLMAGRRSLRCSPGCSRSFRAPTSAPRASRRGRGRARDLDGIATGRLAPRRACG